MIVRFLVLAGLLVGAGPLLAQGTYSVQVLEVDSSGYPEVAVRFQVYAAVAGAPKWEPSMGVDILEEALGDEAPALRVEDVEVCGVRDVSLSVAVDISSSVSSVLGEIKQGAAEVFQSMGTISGTQDSGALYAFSKKKSVRVPADGFTEDMGSLAQAASTLPQGGGSPIWKSTGAELSRLMAFVAPRPERQKRVLAVLTDGRDNGTSPGEIARIVRDARLSDATIVALGYGTVSPEIMERVSSSTGGVFIPQVEGNVGTILQGVVDGARYEYCVTYTSPNQDVVNEPATTTVVTGGDRGSSVYPLPFVIPEDSPGTRLFLPVGKFAYEAYAEAGAFPEVVAELELADRDGYPWSPPGVVDRSPRRAEVRVAPDAWFEDGDRRGFEVPLPEEIVRVPTDPVDLRAGEAGRPPGTHFVLRARYEGPAAGTGRAARYPGGTRVSIQDRTPPHLLLRARPQDGGPLHEAHLLEAEVDQDPALLTGGVPTNAAAHEPGFGSKRARLRGQWRESPEDARTFDRGDQVWSDDAGEPAWLDELGTLHLTAGIRTVLTVLARDNHARLEEHGEVPDARALVEPIPYPGEDPLHARFDETRASATTASPAGPFLPIVPRAELDDDPTRAGIAWWIESPHDRQDRFARFEAPPELAYAYSDRELREDLAANGEAAPEGPLRILHVRAQDGRGNRTAVLVPLVVEEAGFGSKALEYRSERSNALR